MENEQQNQELKPMYLKEGTGLMEGLIEYSQSIRRYSYLLRQLIIVDITNAYKRSFIGVAWMVITPIIAAFVWVLLNGAGIFNPGETAIPYPAYVLLSTSIWSLFHGSYMVTSNIINDSGKFMITAKFPHEVLIIQQLTVHCINFIIPFLINIIVLAVYGIKFSLAALLFPFALIPLVLLGTGIGLIVALLRVVAVDFSRLADQCLNLLMFLTPIVYAPKIKLAWLANIVKYNPLTYLIGFSRDLLTKGVFSEPSWYFLFSFISLVFFVICLRIFMKYEAKLLERLINV